MPWSEKEFDKPWELLEFITNEIKEQPIVYNDSEDWSAREEGFENFDTTSGASIDWLDSFWNETSGNLVAIYKKTDKLIENPMISFFIKNFEEETLYKKNGYYVKKWGACEIENTKWEISLLEAITTEDYETIICININPY